MRQATDAPNVILQPPIAWAIAIVAGFGMGWAFPARFVPASIPQAWAGGSVFAMGFILAMWAVVTMRAAGTQVETTKPTTAIVTNGPFRFIRNPIYVGMLSAQAGLAIGFNNTWMLAMVPPLYLIIRYGVIAREEAYLGQKFAAAYLSYKTRVRRWL